MKGAQAQASGSSCSFKKNCFYAFYSRGEQDTSPDVVTDMFKVFTTDVYASLSLGDTLSLFTPIEAKKLYIIFDIFHEPFIVFTLVDESVFEKRVYKNCPIMFPNRVSLVDLVELDMLDFDITLGMDWLHACFPSIGCRTRVGRLSFQMNALLSGRGKLYT